MGSTPELLPADTFDGYELGDINGTGLAGQVWNARHAESGADVAVEVIGAPLGADSEFRQRLSAEVDRATVLDHPTIASVYEVLASGERIGVVTDSLASARTDALRSDDGLPLAAALFIAEAVLLAMSAAHRAGVVHGAIEPRVISVQGTRVRIGGFGVGRALRPQVPADPSSDTRAVARLVVDLTAGSAAARYASLPRHVRVVLARAAAAKRERHYRTAAGMRSALVNAARNDLGEDWREIAATQLKKLSTATVADASLEAPATAATEISARTPAPAAAAEQETSAQTSAPATPATHETSERTSAPATDAGEESSAPDAPVTRDVSVETTSASLIPVIRAAPSELALRRTTPARSLRRAVAGLALVVLALVVGVAGGAVANALRGSSSATAASLTVGRPVSLQVQPAQGSCNSTFVAKATGPVQGSGTLQYRWARSDGEQSASSALSVSARDGSFLITQHWQLSGPVSHPSITFQLLSPVAMTVTRTLQYACP